MISLTFALLMANIHNGSLCKVQWKSKEEPNTRASQAFQELLEAPGYGLLGS